MSLLKFDFDEFESQKVAVAFPGYAKLVECRRIVDDCLAGQKTIKEKEEYLPPSEWQEKHPEAYRSFLRRALFPGETQYSLSVYSGLFTQGNPRVTLPEDGRLDFIEKNATSRDDSLKEVQMRLNAEQMTHGLRCLLVETRKDPARPFYLQEYPANAFLRAHFTQKDGDVFPDFVLVDESTTVYDLSNFADKQMVRFRIFALDANGDYYQMGITPAMLRQVDILHPKRIIDEANPDAGVIIYPTYRGRKFNRIPFVWCGWNSLSGEEFEMPPMLSTAETELKLYMCMAYNSQHIYMNTQEILVATGVGNNFDIEKMHVGAGGGVALPNADADMKFVGPGGAGFEAEKNEIDDLKAEIEKKRLSLMSAKTHQAGSTIELIQNSLSAPLRITVKPAGLAITQALRFMAQWMEYSEDAVERIEYFPSQKFTAQKLSVAEWLSLCDSVFEGRAPVTEEDLHALGVESGIISSKLPFPDFKKAWEAERERRMDEMAKSVMPTAAATSAKSLAALLSGAGQQETGQTNGQTRRSTSANRKKALEEAERSRGEDTNYDRK